MRINRLELNEFRCYENQVFSFQPNFNVIIGENGKGKTSLLEALAIAINSFVSVLVGSSRPIRKEDVRRVSFEFSLEEKLNTHITAVGFGDNRVIDWTIAKTHRDWGFKTGNDKEIRKWALKCVEELSINGGANLILPLFCYLGSGRLWTESTEKVKIFPKGSRLEGYNHCLNAKGHFKRFVEWFKTMELSGLQGNELSIQNADLVRNVVGKCLEGWDTIIYSVYDDMLMAKRQVGNELVTLPFSYLSDGQRNIIGIIADIAYRCMVLNPQLRENAIKETSGIVLIDELDLHLHPNWQRSIVDNLKDAFPKIQFITTTHSPFIVQSLKYEELIDLEGKELDSDYFRKSIEEIADEEMGVKDVPRSEAFLQMQDVAAKYFDLIEQGKSSESDAEVMQLRNQLNVLEERFSEDPAFVALLKSERKSTKL